MTDIMDMRLRIKKLRESRGVKQGELALAVGIGQNSISRIESGKQQPKLDTLEKIANHLGVDFLDLFEEYARSEAERELFNLLEALTPEELRATRAYIHVLRERDLETAS